MPFEDTGFIFHVLPTRVNFQMVLPRVKPGCELVLRLLQTERARFLDSSDQLLIQHGEGRVRWEVQTIKASVSPVETYTQREYEMDAGIVRERLSFIQWHYTVHLNLISFKLKLI